MIPSQKVQLQIRLQQCRLKIESTPSQYFVKATAEEDDSCESAASSTADKEARGHLISFNCFVRLQLQESDCSKCYLHLLLRQDDNRPSILGTACVKISNSNCNRIKKYQFKKDKETVATIEVGIFLRKEVATSGSHGQGMSMHSHYSTISKQDSSFSADSILDNLKSHAQPSQELGGYSSKLKIVKEVEVSSQDREFNSGDALQLLLTLFEQVSSKNNKISKNEEVIQQKNEEIKCMKIKQLIFHRNDKKIQRLKKQNQFLLVANELMQSKDEKYDEEYSSMKQEKQEMSRRINEVTIQSSHKVMQMKEELEAAKKRLGQRDRKLNGLIQQSQLYDNQINSITSEITTKAKLINILKAELLNEENTPNEPADFLGAFIEQILSQDHSQNLASPKDFMSIKKSNQARQISSSKLQKVKSMSLFKTNCRKSAAKQPNVELKENQVVDQKKAQMINIFEYMLGMQSRKDS